jgi:hypothetical protein
VLNCTEEHFVDALSEVLLLLAGKNRPNLAQKLSKEDICQGLIIMICGIDANYLRKWV